MLPTQTIDVRVERLDPAAIKLLDLNAHFMRHETFARLVENVRDDGALTSTPFCWQLHDDTTCQPQFSADGSPIYEVLSGNHRVKAAVAAGLSLIDCLVTNQYLPPDRRKAIQLSHNAIHGEDDPTLLKLLYEGIEDIGMRLYSGLDDKGLGLMQAVDIASLGEAQLDFQTVSLVFLPDEIDRIDAVWKKARAAAEVANPAWVARWRDYDRALDTLERTSAAYGVKNTATALLVVLAIAERHLDDLQTGYLDAEGEPVDPKRGVPIGSVFNELLIPAATAAKVIKAIKRAARRLGIEGNDSASILNAWADKELNAKKNEQGHPCP